MTIRRVWPRVLGCALLLLPAAARADAIAKHTFALGAERITGVFHADEKWNTGNASGSNGVTTLALFGMNGGGDLVDAWQLPRIAMDYFVANGFSIGGSFVVLSRSPENSNRTDFIIAPRVGFGYMFSRVVGIWPRIGMSYWHGSWSNDPGNLNADAHSFAFDLDVPLLIAPVRSFAITLGPLLDVGFAGRVSGNVNVLGLNVNGGVDTSFVQFGLSAGIVGLL